MSKEMTLEQAYKITEKMHIGDHKNPTPEQSQAKSVIYSQVIHPKYADKNGEVLPYMEPDFNEGWGD